MIDINVIGLIGFIGAGKDVAARYLIDKYHYTMIGMGDLVRELAQKEHLAPTRENLSAVQKKYRDKYGADYFAQQVIEYIRTHELTNVIVNGIRRPEDITPLEKAFGSDLHIVFIRAGGSARFERMKRRRRVGDPKTLDEFHAQEKDQAENYNYDEAMKHVQHEVENNSTIEQFHKNLDEFMKKIQQ